MQHNSILIEHNLFGPIYSAQDCNRKLSNEESAPYFKDVTAHLKLIAAQFSINRDQFILTILEPEFALVGYSHLHPSHTFLNNFLERG